MRNTSEMVLTSLLGALHERVSVKKKMANSRVVPLGKVPDGIPPSLCDRQVTEQAAYSSRWLSETKDN